ncbi:MAG TPA: hypothetical protein VGB13_09030, partial [Candidatus Krumholzibacteria bacterium]
MPFALFGCQDEPFNPSSASTAQRTEIATPAFESFALYAGNSILLRDGAQVAGGHVGVERSGTGPFLLSGFELAADEEVTIDAELGFYGDSVRLGSMASFGDVYTNQLVDQGAAYGTVYEFVEQAPLPDAPNVEPGVNDVTVASSTQVSLSPGGYDDVTVHGTLRLEGGRFDLSELTVEAGARV